MSALPLSETFDVMQAAMLDEADAVRACAERLDRSSVLRALETLNAAGTCFVSGVGKSGLVARKIAASLTSTGRPAVFLHPVEALHGDIGLVGENDCAILLSKSGATEEILRLLPALKSRGVVCIGILGTPNSPLAGMVDVVLDASVEREACKLNAAPTSSTTTALAVGDALAVALMHVNGIGHADFARHHPLGQLGRNLTLHVRDVMHSGDEMPLVSPLSDFREALIVSTAKHLGCVLIAGEDGALRGILTDGDVRRALQRHEDIRQLRAGEVMTPDPICADPDMLLGQALELMENRRTQISVLPVVDKSGTLHGLIRLHDIVRAGGEQR